MHPLVHVTRRRLLPFYHILVLAALGEKHQLSCDGWTPGHLQSIIAAPESTDGPWPGLLRRCTALRKVHHLRGRWSR